MFLAWWDSSKKVDPREKARQGIEAYRVKFKEEPEIVLVGDALGAELGEEVHGLRVETAHYIAANTFYLGQHDPRVHQRGMRG